MLRALFSPFCFSSSLFLLSAKSPPLPSPFALSFLLVSFPPWFPQPVTGEHALLLLATTVYPGPLGGWAAGRPRVPVSRNGFSSRLDLDVVAHVDWLLFDFFPLFSLTLDPNRLESTLLGCWLHNSTKCRTRFIHLQPTFL